MVSKVTYKIRLKNLSSDVDKLSPGKKDELKDEVGEFVIDKILEDASKQRSSVTGQRWKGLSKLYKKEKSKVAAGVANLELTGSYLDSLEFKKYRDGVEVGFFDDSDDNVKKADNHNKFSAKALSTKLPQRQSIPKKEQRFRSGVVDELKKVVREFVNDNVEDEAIRAKAIGKALASLGVNDGD